MGLALVLIGPLLILATGLYVWAPRHARSNAEDAAVRDARSAAVALAAWLWPEYVQAEQINGLAYGGALLVVLGSALVALGPSLIAGLRARRMRAAVTRIS